MMQQYSNSLVSKTEDMTNEDVLDLVRMIAEDNENFAKMFVSSLIRRSDERLLNEYEILEINMFIDRRELSAYYGDKIDKMPGLKLLLSLNKKKKFKALN